MGGWTTTGTGAVTTGTGKGIPKLIPTWTPAFTVVIPAAARARIAIAFVIFTAISTHRRREDRLQIGSGFVIQCRRVAGSPRSRAESVYREKAQIQGGLLAAQDRRRQFADGTRKLKAVA